MISDKTISGKIAKEVFEIVLAEGGDPREIVENRGLKQVTDLGAIEKAVDDVIAANPDKVDEVRDKPKMAGWFVGQVMLAAMAGCVSGFVRVWFSKIRVSTGAETRCSRLSLRLQNRWSTRLEPL